MAALALHGCMAAPDVKAAGSAARAKKAQRGAFGGKAVAALGHEPGAAGAAAHGTAPLVLLSDGEEPFRTLASELTNRLGPETEVLTLGKDVARERLPSVLSRGNGPIVAVGLEAALALTEEDERDVIFTMVFNHGDNRLLQQGMIGVSMLPPPAQVLRTLKQLSPGTTRISMPAGPNLGSYRRLAETEAARLGMSLAFAEVGSDKELLLLVKKLNPAIEAVWLLPDNRIMSRERLQQVMAVNLKGSRRTVVFSPTLFSIGGLLSAEYSIPAIADCIAEIIAKTPGERDRMKGTMRQPPSGTLAINGAVAAALGLKVPPALKPLVVKGGVP